MIFVYDSRKRTIRELSCDYPTCEIELTLLESKLVEALSNGRENTWYELIEYMYENENSNREYTNVSSIKTNLLRKVKLNIITNFGYGLILRDTIYIR